MTRITRIMLALVGLIVLGWMATATARRVYFAPHAKLATDLETVTVRVTRFQDGLDDAAHIETDIQAYVDRTLGGDRETVDHRLRSRLNRLAEQLQLEEITVGTGRAVRRTTPAKREFSRRDKALRDEIDFVELNGWVTATGSLRQVLMLVDALETDPWLKRIDQYRIDPKDNGERFSAMVRLTTLFLPGREPRSVASPPYDPAQFDRYGPLVNVNHYRLPDPKPEATPASPAPPVDALAAWTLTGIVEAAGGAEVWLHNSSTNESHTLRAGESYNGITLISARGEMAVFSDGDIDFVLQVGHVLSDRSRVNR